MKFFDDEIFGYVARTNGKNGFPIFLYVLNNIVVTVHNIKKRFNIADVDLNKVLSNLERSTMVSVFRRSDDKELYVGVNGLVYNKILKECDGCTNKREKEKDGIKLEICINPSCCNSGLFNNYNKYIYIRKISNFESATVVKISSNQNVVHEDVENWGVKEFGQYFIDKHLKEFRGVKLKYSRLEMVSVFKEMLIVFKRLVGDKDYVLYCKRHIDQVMKSCKKSDDFHLRMFLNMDAINKTIGKGDAVIKKNAKVKAEFCALHDIHCGYYDGCCTIARDGMECTDEIRSYMKNKYGV